MTVVTWLVIGAIVAFAAYRVLSAPEPQANPHLTCPHCHTKGQVVPRALVRKKGISGGKATGAVLTGGASLLATGLSRKEATTNLTCGHCGMSWDVA